MGPPEENTPLVCQAIEVRKSVYGNCSEGLAGALRKTAKGKLEAYIKRMHKELAENVEKTSGGEGEEGGVSDADAALRFHAVA